MKHNMTYHPKTDLCQLNQTGLMPTWLNHANNIYIQLLTKYNSERQIPQSEKNDHKLGLLWPLISKITHLDR